jgi:hypothetical protein
VELAGDDGTVGGLAAAKEDDAGALGEMYSELGSGIGEDADGVFGDGSGF